MDEEPVMKELDLEDFLRPACPVKVGDRIYRRKTNMTIPDRMVVEKIIPNNDGKTYTIRVRYMYHVIGPFEREYSDSIFKDENWVIETGKAA